MVSKKKVPEILIDPLGQPTITAGRDHCPSVPTFQNLPKQNKVKTMFAIGETLGLAEWIIDDTCLVVFYCCSMLKKFELTVRWLPMKMVFALSQSDLAFHDFAEMLVLARCRQVVVDKIHDYFSEG